MLLQSIPLKTFGTTGAIHFSFTILSRTSKNFFNVLVNATNLLIGVKVYIFHQTPIPNEQRSCAIQIVSNGSDTGQCCRAIHQQKKLPKTSQ
jgi:hypothetical protein